MYELTFNIEASWINSDSYSGSRDFASFIEAQEERKKYVWAIASVYPYPGSRNSRYDDEPDEYFCSTPTPEDNADEGLWHDRRGEPVPPRIRRMAGSGLRKMVPRRGRAHSRH